MNNIEDIFRNLIIWVFTQVLALERLSVGRADKGPSQLLG